jgi:hypothetical protein
MKVQAKPAAKTQYDHSVPKKKKNLKIPLTQVPFNVTMEEPGAWVVGDEAKFHHSTTRNMDRVAPDGIGVTFFEGWIYLWIIRSNIFAFVNNCELVSVQVAGEAGCIR